MHFWYIFFECYTQNSCFFKGFGFFCFYSQTIVALNQVGSDVGFSSVPVDVAKLADGYAIAVAIGGTDVGTTAKAIIKYTTEVQTVAYAVTYKLGGGTADGNPEESNSDETIADFFAKVVTEPTKDGFTFLHWSKTEDGTAIDTTSTEKMSTLLDEGSETTVTLYAVYEKKVKTIEILIGDVNLDGIINANDSAALLQYVAIPAASTPSNNNRRKALIDNLAANGFEFKGKESYTLSDGSGTVLIGDINLDTIINANDSAALLQYVAIPAANTPSNNNRRKALIDNLAANGFEFKGKESRTVNQK